MIVMALSTDGNHRYSRTKNKRSPFVSWTRPRTLRCKCSAANCTLFDHLVGARQQRRRYFEAERLRGLEIDHELELGPGRMDWACILAYITGTVDQELLLRNEYLATERGRDRAPYVAARSADIGAAAFSASSRLFDLKSEATTRISARLFADVM
jgi:hypothetical protein